MPYDFVDYDLRDQLIEDIGAAKEGNCDKELQTWNN